MKKVAKVINRIKLHIKGKEGIIIKTKYFFFSLLIVFTFSIVIVGCQQDKFDDDDDSVIPLLSDTMTSIEKNVASVGFFVDGDYIKLEVNNQEEIETLLELMRIDEWSQFKSSQDSVVGGIYLTINDNIRFKFAIWNDEFDVIRLITYENEALSGLNGWWFKIPKSSMEDIKNYILELKAQDDI